jgi:hypothetical protein
MARKDGSIAVLLRCRKNSHRTDLPIISTRSINPK